MPIKCPKCRSDNTDTARFCSNCATSLTGAESGGPSFTKTPATPVEIPRGTLFAEHYEIIEKLGQGGMGEVYRALDRNLGRQVAVKVLPQEFSEEPERLARFEREAKLLAALNHPNIASIYGLEEAGKKRFLVLELVEGETLNTRLDRGTLPVEEALETCRQVADGLEAAHEKGVIHRDLKPGNIMITPEGKVKILDFGLAKAHAAETTGIDIANSPTITAQMTEPGVILGTAAYMSPEQARSRSVDRRTDIWAFGCVLFECLTGKRTFHGETVSDTLAHILKGEPDWGALPQNTPTAIRSLLRRCLQKNPKNRLRDIGDARIEIDDALTASAAEIMGAARPVSKWRILFWAASGLTLVLCCVLLWSLLRSPRATPGAMKHLMINLPEKAPVAPAGTSPLGVGRPALTLSPDGSILVYVAVVGDHTQLYLRRMDQDEIQPIQGTDGAHSPFFSPDGKWVGFFADEKLKKVPISGGEPEILCAAPLGFGGSWGSTDIIFFIPTDTTEIWKISSVGGSPQPLINLASQKESLACHWPEILPGGDAVLYSLRDGGISVFSVRSGRRKMFLDSGSYARYSPSGHIVYADRGKLRAVRFQLDKLEVTGLPVTVLDGVRTERQGAAQFALSRDGSIAYVPGIDATLGTLQWIDRSGKAEPLGLPKADYGAFKISPDGQAIAIPIIEAGNSNIWIYNLTRGTLTRFTFGQADYSPIWTPDGRWIVFSSGGNGTEHFYKKLADGSGEAEQITENEPCLCHPASFSLEGKQIASFCRTMDLWIFPFERGQEPRPFLQTRFIETFPAFSPNGRWIAYTSDESGRWEIYVRPYPGPGGKWRVSTDGGEESRWSQSGQELFYRFGNRWMAVKVDSGDEFSAGKPYVLFEGPYINIQGYSYDVSPDGQRFLVVEGSEQELAVGQVHVITNWLEELKRLVPAGK